MKALLIILYRPNALSITCLSRVKRVEENEGDKIWGKKKRVKEMLLPLCPVL